MRSAILSETDLAHFRDKGWVTARGFFPPAEAERLARWSAEIEAMPEVPGRQMVYWEQAGGGRILQRIENFCPFHAGMDGLVRAGRLMAAVEALLQAPSLLYK